MSWKGLRRQYVSMLSRKGFRPEVDEDGDICFEREGRTYFITSNCDDGYFAILYAGFWGVADGAELSKAYLAASAASRNTKACYVWIGEEAGGAFAEAGFLIARAANVESFISRAISCLQTAVDTFEKKMAAV
jgi:hypothetical protein